MLNDFLFEHNSTNISTRSKKKVSSKSVFILIFFSFSQVASSQNHGTVEIGKDLWRASGSTPLFRKEYLEQDAQDHVQSAFC